MSDATQQEIRYGLRALSWFSFIVSQRLRDHSVEALSIKDTTEVRLQMARLETYLDVMHELCDEYDRLSEFLTAKEAQ